MNKTLVFLLLPFSLILTACDDGVDDPYYYPTYEGIDLPVYPTVPKYDFTNLDIFKKPAGKSKKTYTEEEIAVANDYLTELTTDELQLKEEYGLDYRATSNSKFDFSSSSTIGGLNYIWEFSAELFILDDDELQERFPGQNLDDVKLKMYDDLWSHALKYQELEKHEGALTSSNDSFQDYGKMSAKLKETGHKVGVINMVQNTQTARDEMHLIKELGLSKKKIVSGENYNEIIITQSQLPTPYKLLGQSLEIHGDVCGEFDSVNTHTTFFEIPMREYTLLKSYCGEDLMTTLNRVFVEDDLNDISTEQVKAKVSRYNQALAQYTFQVALDSLKKNGFELNNSNYTFTSETRKTWEKDQFIPFKKNLNPLRGMLSDFSDLDDERVKNNYNRAIVTNGHNNLKFYVEAVKHLFVYTTDANAQNELVKRLNFSQATLDKYPLPKESDRDRRVQVFMFGNTSVGTNPYEQQVDLDKVFEIMNSMM